MAQAAELEVEAAATGVEAQTTLVLTAAAGVVEEELALQSAQVLADELEDLATVVV